MVFYYMDAKNTVEVFQKLQVQRVPLIFHIPPNESFKMGEDNLYPITTEESLLPQSMAKWVSKMSGVTVTLPLKLFFQIFHFFKKR